MYPVVLVLLYHKAIILFGLEAWPSTLIMASKVDFNSASVEKLAGTQSQSDSDDAKPEIDPAAERKLLLKLDLIIYPVFIVMYMLSFLDRISISNARIQGMVPDLDLVGNRFNIALFVCTWDQQLDTSIEDYINWVYRCFTFHMFFSKFLPTSSSNEFDHPYTSPA